MNKFYILLVMLFAHLSLFGQTHVCGVGLNNDEGEIIMKRLTENLKFLDKYKNHKSGALKYIPVKIHILSEDDGSGKLFFVDVIGELCDLNENFADTGFKFYLKDGTVDYLYNTTYYNAPASNAGLRYLSANKDSDAVNIFIAKTVGDTDIGTVLGRYYNSYDIIIVRKANVNSGDETLTHEVGHFFSLPHTFYGWENDQYDKDKHGQQVTLESHRYNGRNIRVELVDQSNCRISSDKICDTAPNYLFGLGYSRNCPPFNQIVIDRLGDTIVPNQNNYMSYFSGCDPYHFSDEQMRLMNIDYNRSDRQYLRSDYIPNDNTITEEIQIYSPRKNETVSGYNEVILDWSEVEYADSYFVRIAGGGKIFQYQTNESWLLTTDLSPRRTYSWKVTPYNETSGCAVSASRLLKTPTTTSTKDESFVNGFYYFPNPLHSEEDLSIHLDAKYSGKGMIELLTIDGKMIVKKSVKINLGNNNYFLNISKKRGVYILKVTTNKGVLSRKLIIN